MEKDEQIKFKAIQPPYSMMTKAKKRAMAEKAMREIQVLTNEELIELYEVWKAHKEKKNS